VVVNRAHLAGIRLRLLTVLGFGPGGTRLIDAGSPAGRAMEVSKSRWVTVGEAGPCRVVELVKLGDSR
jgi:hypothetical protein